MIDSQVFFDGWAGIVRTIVVGVLSYVGLIALLRISGKRTLAKMNAFDLVVTVALGSTFASVLTSRDLPVARGFTALALLVVLQYGITWSAVRARWVRTLVKSEPTLLVRQGELLRDAMRRERVTEGDVDAAARDSGVDDRFEIDAMILETDGSFSVIRRGS